LMNLLIDLTCFAGMGLIVGFQYVIFIRFSKDKRIQYYFSFGCAIGLMFLLIFIDSKVAVVDVISVNVGIIRTVVFIVGLYFGRSFGISISCNK